MPTIIVLMGAPGAGKGTQARLLQERLSLPQISTGDIFRSLAEANTPLANEVREIQQGGRLIPDRVVIRVVAERTSQDDCRNGYILDGFPRTAAQAAALDTIVDPSALIVVLLAASDEDIIRRLALRRICDACAITQSIPDGSEDRDGCPYCGGQLVRRPDDHPDTVRRRLATYAEFATPVMEFYRDRRTFGIVDGLRSAAEVTAALSAHIDRFK